MSDFKLSKRSLRNRSQVDSRLIEISNLAIKLTLIDFGHGNDSGKRTAKRQNKLFKGGSSKADGYNKISLHQSGMALDFYAFVNGKASWDKDHLALVACSFLQAASMLGYKLEWGGLWGWDYPHVQLIEV